jgi:hypothetical protein
MNPVQAAIKRILMQHYGGNVNDPRAQNWAGRMLTNPPVAPAQHPAFRQWLQMRLLGGQ